MNDNLENIVEKEIFIYNEAKKEGIECFFEKLNTVKENDIFYWQNKLIVKPCDMNIIFENWLMNIGKEKNLKLIEFIEKWKIYDLSPSNIGFNEKENIYKIIDY